jgi:hypothetical protein
MTSQPQLTQSFDRAMNAIYDNAKAAGYNATRFLIMVREHGGLETAHRLLGSSDVSYGFTELWMLGRTDLTVEALALKPEFTQLFSEIELKTAAERLGVRQAEPGRVDLDAFQIAAAEFGPTINAIVSKFTTWLDAHRDAVIVGKGETGPLYFAPRALDGKRVPVVCVGLDGRVQVLFNDLVLHAPFNRTATRIELQVRLNRIVGFDVSDEVVEMATWQATDGAYLLSPGAFGQLAAAYEWAAERIAGGA